MADYSKLRHSMVENQIHRREINDQRVLQAMRKVERHLFVLPKYMKSAYSDSPLPIDEGQTISQPFIVAFMVEAALLPPKCKVLEIGAGSGYGAAVLGEICEKVISLEIVENLAKKSSALLKKLKYTNVEIFHANGYKGHAKEAPYDAIIVTAAPEKVPRVLIDQLKVGGHLIIPVGKSSQELKRITRTSEGEVRELLLPVRFVPMTGKESK